MSQIGEPGHVVIEVPEPIKAPTFAPKIPMPVFVPPVKAPVPVEVPVR